MNQTGINAPLPNLQADGTAHSERLPVLHLAVGRDRTGVTAHLHAVVQHYRERGANLRIWATGLYRLTRTLSDLHADAAKPPQSALDEIESWLEEQIPDQQEHGYDAVLDLDEGAVLLRQLEAVSALLMRPSLS